MHSSAYLVISHYNKMEQTLRQVVKYVRNLLYVRLELPGTQNWPAPAFAPYIMQLYASKAIADAKLDVRVLVAPLKAQQQQQQQQQELLQHKVDLLLYDHERQAQHYAHLRQSLGVQTDVVCLPQKEVAATPVLPQLRHKFHTFQTVVLGGTFDRIHLGHKIFLTQAVLRAKHKLIVGVTTEQMTKNKILPELILPVQQRISEVREFLMDIDSTLCYNVVPIDDAFGPTITEPNIDMIVVSEETRKGGDLVNQRRKERQMHELQIISIELVPEYSAADGPREQKVSSSNQRMDLLGTRLRTPEPKPQLAQRPYVIGLTGGIASGKSKMSQHFQELGAHIIDCDKVGHEAYEPGTPCYTKIVNHFGLDVLDAYDRIDRRKLGAIVFSDPKQLTMLNQLVWPEIQAEVKRRIQNVEITNTSVVVVEAALLLQAGWDSQCHEVWSMIIPPAEAVRRMATRDHTAEADAWKKLSHHISNQQLVAKSHVVFCSQWEAAFTKQQAQRAWQMLMQEINKSNETGVGTSNKL